MYFKIAAPVRKCGRYSTNIFYNKNMDIISRIENDIKSLKIQGATNIALSTIDGLTNAINLLEKQPIDDPHRFLYEQVTKLAFARPTEPLAQNALRFIFSEKQKDIKNYLHKGDQYRSMIKDSKKKMGEYGSNLIQNGGTYLTHCHSSTVTDMFIHAHRQGKKFSVITTETRPLYQGRITAKDLLQAGIKSVTMIIDDLATSIILENKIKISAVFIGADLLSEKGFVNKVGSHGIAFCAAEKHIPLYCTSILLKFDPKPFTGDIIEKRSSAEIWPDSPSELRFYSPSFDFIPYSDNISIVSEAGTIGGDRIKNDAVSLYPFLITAKSAAS